MNVTTTMKLVLIAIVFLLGQIVAFYQPSDRLAYLISMSTFILGVLALSFMQARGSARSRAAQLRTYEALRDSRLKQSKKEFEILEAIRDLGVKQSKKEFEILTAIERARPQTSAVRTSLHEERRREIAIAEERRAQQALQRLFVAVLDGQNQILTRLDSARLNTNVRENDE